MSVQETKDQEKPDSLGFRTLKKQMEHMSPVKRRIAKTFVVLALSLFGLMLVGGIIGAMQDCVKQGMPLKQVVPVFAVPVGLIALIVVLIVRKPRIPARLGGTEELQTGEALPYAKWRSVTWSAFLVLFKAVVLFYLFLLVGGIALPITAILVFLGIIPNGLGALFSGLLTIPLLLCLPFQAAYCLAQVMRGKTPKYSKGIYAATDWLRKNRIYDPLYDSKTKKTTLPFWN